MLRHLASSAAPVLLAASALCVPACGPNQMIPAPATEPSTAPLKETPAEAKKTSFASRIGKQLFERDRAAWLATDLLRPKIKPGTSRGWLTEQRGAEWVVSWLGTMPIPTTSGDIQITHQVVYDPATDRARIKNTVPIALNPTQQAAFRARTLVEKALPSQKPLCGTYNLVVMPAEAAGTGRRGWLIYALVAMPQLGIYPVGGFHEFLVSPDGGRIIETRALSRGCLNLGGEKLPEGASLAAYTATDVISDTPLPQHVFVSLQSKKPLFVMTVRNRRTWRVDGDQIVLVGM